MSRSAGIPPIVYVGPTMATDAVVSLLPGADVRPPIRRGDLHRDRLLRHSVFVILDGVFHQHEAISPREIVEVVGDGAHVVGASSMGAIRAAECWPAGMIGIGAVYRLFRRGSLMSDDEVAVAFDPDDPTVSTVALVNVRASLRRAVRAGRLDDETARSVARSASAVDFRDRRWRRILQVADVDDPSGELARWLGTFDLKRADASTALRHVAADLDADPEALRRPRRTTAPFTIGGPARERRHDPLAGRSVELERPEFARWLVVSGEAERRRLVEPARAAATDQWIGDAWSTLAQHDELDALLFGWRAVRTAPDRAAQLGCQATDDHVRLAEAQIAAAHQCASFDAAVDRWAAHSPTVAAWLVAHRTTMVWATCLRARLLGP